MSVSGQPPGAEATGTASGYAFVGAALEPGVLLRDGVRHPDARIRVPLPVLNRHGPVAGATGTGGTKTLQPIAEQLSATGCGTRCAPSRRTTRRP
ncbi:hypothetical protein GCM10010275_07390 [Streptomyces litmocidini]|nr:hypothetical protein GCM10010275_07390 [Streptomyces litmocidini]